jgi:hypothetical protein
MLPDEPMQAITRAIVLLLALAALAGLIWVYRAARQETVERPPEPTAETDDGVIGLAKPILNAENDRILVIEYPPWPQNEWLYRLPEYAISHTETSELRPAPVETRADASLVFSGGFYESKSRAVLASYQIVVTPEEGGVSFEAKLTNQGSKTWNPAVHSVLCFENARAPDFHDFEGDRTAIMIDGAFVSVDNTAFARTERTKQEILSKLSAQTKMEAVKRAPPFRGHLLRPEDEAWVSKPQRVRGSEYVSSSLIVRSSQDRRRHVALAWGNARQVSYNLNESLNCLHSSPGFGGLTAGESRTARGKLYFAEGPLDAVYQRYKRDFPNLGFGE